MVTGDQPPTAAAIAHKVNILKHPQKEFNYMVNDLKMDNHSNLNYEDNELMSEMNQSIEVTEAIKEFYKFEDIDNSIN